MTTVPGAAALPPQVRLASTLLLVLGGLLVVSGVLIVLARAGIADGVVSAAQEQQTEGTPSRSDLIGSLAVVGGVFVTFGAAALIVGYHVRQRRSWARILGIGLGVLLGVMGIQFLLAGGAGLIALLLPIGAIGVAVTVVSTLLSGPAARWFRGEPA